MSKWKIVIAAVLAVILLPAAGFGIASYFEPSLDPGFEQKLAKAEPEGIRELIAAEAENLGVTALSVTVLEAGQEPQSHYFGRAKQGGLMQVASLSKAVAATAILILAEQQGVGLDGDIRGQVTSVDIASLEGGDRPVTLRQLLSHTTGASQSGYPGYPRGSALLSTADVIDAPPRIFESQLVFDGVPGEFRYSGGGYTIAQLWAEDTTGKSFEAIADELLLGSLGMEQSTFAQPLDEADIAPLAMVGADSGFAPTQGVFSAIENSWHVYPEKAAAGLWSTSEDYARFAAALLDAAAGEENPIPAKIARAMLTPEAETDFMPGTRYGFGVMLTPKGDGGIANVWHTGANAGYRTLFMARPGSAEKPRRVVVSLGNTARAAELNQAIGKVLLER